MFISKRALSSGHPTYRHTMNYGNKDSAMDSPLLQKSSSAIHNCDALRLASRRPLLIYAPPWSVEDCSRCLQHTATRRCNTSLLNLDTAVYGMGTDSWRRCVDTRVIRSAPLQNVHKIWALPVHRTFKRNNKKKKLASSLQLLRIRGGGSSA
jgi:hypothetical protein